MLKEVRPTKIQGYRVPIYKDWVIEAKGLFGQSQVVLRLLEFMHDISGNILAVL